MNSMIKVSGGRILFILAVSLAGGLVSAARAGDGAHRSIAAPERTGPTVSAANLGSLASTILPGGNIVQPGRPLTTTTVYLPVVSRAPQGLYGRVTLNGTPSSGVQLQLWRRSGPSNQQVDSLDTKADGSYEFVGEPSLGAGESYYVEFANNALSADGRLAFWYTRSLTAYAAGHSVAIEDFDLLDFPLGSPAANATVTPPATFTWTVRAGFTSDNYQVKLFQSNGPARFRSPLIGYIGFYQLNSLPPGFSTGVTYRWQVLVNSLDGGLGVSFETRDITFSNTGQGASSAVTPAEGPEHRQVLERLFEDVRQP
jgi:hypothetical protein